MDIKRKEIRNTPCFEKGCVSLLKKCSNCIHFKRTAILLEIYRKKTCGEFSYIWF